MRHFRGAIAIFLIASGISFGQVPADWDQWVADGLAAEDNSEYKDAEKLFSQACSVGAIEQLGSERLAHACLLLSQLYSTQNDLAKASKAAEALVDALEAYPESRLVDRVSALTEAASVRAARGYFDEAEDQLRTAVRLAGDLEAIERAKAYSNIASFLLPADLQALGGDFLRAATANLVNHPNWTDVQFVNAAVKVGSALFWFDRRSEALELLAPAIDAARLRATGDSQFDDLWQAYSDSARVFVSVLRSQGAKDRAAELSEERRTWPRAPTDVLQVGGEVIAPHVLRHTNPSYTLGAGSKGRKVQGTVVVYLEVWPDGRAHNIKIVRPLAYGLSWAAIGAIRKWRFQPATRDGEPVKVWAEVETNFRIVP